MGDLLETYNKVKETLKKYNKIEDKLKKTKKDLLKTVYEYSLNKFKDNGIKYRDYKQHNFDIEEKFSLITTYGGLDRYLIQIWLSEDCYYASLSDFKRNEKIFGKFEIIFKNSNLDGLINCLSIYCNDDYPYEGVN